jgi:hypothetical protein
VDGLFSPLPAIGKCFELYKPEVVFHAAAHKHVPLMERNARCVLGRFFVYRGIGEFHLT